MDVQGQKARILINRYYLHLEKDYHLYFHQSEFVRILGIVVRLTLLMRESVCSIYLKA